MSPALPGQPDDCPAATSGRHRSHDGPPGKALGFIGPYQGYLNPNCTTLAEVLKAAGDHRLMTGKWQLDADRTELNDLAAARPQVRNRLVKL